MTPKERVAKAIAKADAKWWAMIKVNDGSVHGLPDQGLMQATAVLAALSADGPVIVVDGKVMPVLVSDDLNPAIDYAPWIEGACKASGIDWADFAHVLDALFAAAREVAGKEEQ